MTQVVISLRGQLDIQRQALRHDNVTASFHPDDVTADNSVRVIYPLSRRQDETKLSRIS
jgi:hypothetical protein